MDKAYFKEYYIQERQHWWFLARMEILQSQITTLVKPKEKLKILNIGIATGATTEMLSKFGNVTSLEYDEDCCQFVKETLDIPVVHGSILSLPFEDGEFDLVCAFDVIEHVEDDKLAVAEMKRVCSKNGFVFVTVPAFMDLWSDHDLINHHFRRYIAKGLKALFVSNGEVVYSSYFNSILFPPIYFVRRLSNLLKSKSKEAPQSDFTKFKPGLLNNLLYRLFKLEKRFLNKQFHFPAGVSIMLIWRKIEE